MKKISLSALLLCACQTTPPAITGAHLHATPAAQQQLHAAVTALLGVSQLTLVNNALTNSSYLAIARTPRSDLAGQLLQGRVLERPHTFHLFMQGTACWLEHVNTGRRLPINAAHCLGVRE